MYILYNRYMGMNVEYDVYIPTNIGIPGKEPNPPLVDF